MFEITTLSYSIAGTALAVIIPFMWVALCIWIMAKVLKAMYKSVKK